MEAKEVDRFIVKAQQEIAACDSTLAAYDSNLVREATCSNNRPSVLLPVDLRQERVYKP